MKHAILSLVLLMIAPSVQAADPFALGGKRDNKAPIEINADKLDVLQEENKAIFTGHVVAIQGTVRLKAEKMTVYYKKQEEGAKKKSPSEENAIQKIDVEGNVFLTTPEETARGAVGVYDVENHRIVLDNNVVLTRAKNTLKGDHLVYDFATGKSTLSSGGKTTAAGAVTSGGRVRALFVPENKEKK